MAQTKDHLNYSMARFDDVPMNNEGVKASFMDHGNGHYTLASNGGPTGMSVTVHLTDATIDEMVRLRNEWTSEPSE